MQGLEQLRRRRQDPAVRSEELVGRAGHEVDPQRGLVHQRVRGEVDGVDVDERPDLVGGRGDRRDVGAGAEEVGGAGHRHQPGALAQHAAYVVEVGRLRDRSPASARSPRRAPPRPPTGGCWRRGRAGSPRPRPRDPTPGPGCARGPRSTPSSSARRRCRPDRRRPSPPSPRGPAAPPRPYVAPARCPRPAGTAPTSSWPPRRRPPPAAPTTRRGSRSGPAPPRAQGSAGGSR